MKQHKKFKQIAIIVLLFVFVIQTACSNSKKNTYSDLFGEKEVKKVNSDLEELSFVTDYQNNITIEVEQSNQNETTANVKIVTPNLAMLYDDAMEECHSKENSISEEEYRTLLYNTIRKNMSKSTIEEIIETEVINDGSKLVPVSSDDIDQVIHEQMDSFFIYLLDKKGGINIDWIGEDE